MRGGSCRCVLVLLVVIVPLALVRGQTGEGQTGGVQPERITSDQVAADFVRAAANAVLPRTEQSPQIAPSRPLPPIIPWGPIGFPRMAQAAGIIFSGTVTSVTRRPATRAQAIETV